MPASRIVTGRTRVAGLVATATALLCALAIGGYALGRPRLELEMPGPGQEVGLEGLEVLVRFAPAERVEPATFRALLNGADVTGRFEVAANGAHGRLHGLLDGPNELRLEVFGRHWLPFGRLLERVEVRRVVYRRPLSADRG